MRNTKRGKRNMRAKKRIRQHKLSMIGISSVIVVLAVILFVACSPAREKNDRLKEQEAKLEAQLKNEELRSEEIDELESYVGEDEYIENVAKDKLGLAYPDETLIKEEP